MRDKLILTLGVLGTLLMLWNFNTIFGHLPDEAQQGAIYRIIFIHVPAAISAYVFYGVAVIASVGFLVKKNFAFDSLAVAAIEVGQVFTLVNLVTGSIWGRIIWGIWWTWDLRLTSQLVCFVLYLGYLLLRPAVNEPTQRATMSAILAIFASVDIPLVIMAIRFKNVRTQHPQPVLETGGLDPSFWPPLLISFAALLLIGTALVMIRLHQESTRREVDSLRRELHAV
jgi:heme exporter protein C